MSNILTDFLYLNTKYKILCVFQVYDTGRHCEIQIVYNTGRYRTCGGQFLTLHTVRGSPASLSHQASDRPCYRFFNF